ncbi:MAG: hypothetical protein ABIG39_02290 [Candidatus Micrarchaeota archaeon]
MKKGQIFTIDFVISLAVFVTILITIITLWMGIDLHIKEIESRREMHLISIAISDALIRSPGYPADWNETNVQSIGIAKGEYVLDIHKIIALMNLEYDTARSILRLGNYQLFIYMTDIDGANISTGVLRSPIAYYCRNPTLCTIQAKLNSSGLVWDMYQGTGSDVSSQYNERYYYRADDYFPDPPFTDPPASMFNFTVLNLSNYKTFIVERPNIQNEAVNITGMQEFLQNSGVLLFESQGDQGFLMLENNFSMHAVHQGSTTGTVEYLGVLLLNMSVGDTINFDDASWRFYEQEGDANLITYISDQADPLKCLVCEWNYGRGTVYYIQDYDGVVNGDITRPLQDNLNFIGWQIRYGIPPNSSSIDVININRMALLEGVFRQPVAVHILIWR